MYYYAFIDSVTGICYDVYETDTPITDDPYCIQLDSYDKTYMFRKKYEDGVWNDTTAEEAQQFEGSHIGIFGEWLDVVINGKAPVDHTHSGYAMIDHTHTGYASSDDLTLLEDVIGTKADSTHTHTEYALSAHAHSDYATVTAIDAVENELDGKANANHSHAEYSPSVHTHNEYAEVNHSHNNYSETTHTHSEYAGVNHSHDDYATQASLDTLSEEVEGKADVAHNHSEYALSTHEHGNYASSDHNHNSSYAPLSHNHADYVTMTDFDALESEVDGKASSTHTHTASEIGAATSGHNHDSDYAAVGHDHDEDYATIGHLHNDYATVDSLTELSTTVSGKANASHTHDDRYFTETEINTKLANKADSSHTHTGVYDVSGAAASALVSANAYTDSEIESLSETIAAKANTSDLTSHTGNTTVHITSTERNNWNAAKTHANSAHAPSNAEENQNAFSNIVVNGTTIAADAKMDTLALVAGNNVTITPDATGDSITISSANTVYTHPTTAGNKHIPAGGSSGQILRWSADGTAVWGNDNNTTYSNATQTASGLMSNTDKTKLDGIAEGANKYILPSAGASLGGVKTGGDVTIASGVITVNDDSHNHIISNVDGLQSALDGKATSNHDHNSVYYTETEIDTLLSGKANSSHTHTIANITNLQSALDGKAATSHGTHVSYSTTVPVMDGTASVGTASTVARSDHKHPVDTSRAAQTSLDSHTSNKSNPHGVTLAQLGVTATASELNKMDGITATTAELNILDGITATTAELNYVDGVTSNIQTQLNGKAASSHGTHVTYSTTVPKANGTAAVGTASTISRSDHVHPLQTTVSGNAGTATTISKRVKITSSQSANVGKYIKFGTITLSSAYSGFMGYLMFNPTESSAGANGLLHLHIRNGADTTTTSCTMKWLTINESKYEKTVSAVKVSNGVFDLYYKPIGTWDTMEIIVVSGDNHNTLSLANSGTYVDSITATYTSSTGGQVNYANSAGSATSATTATTASACSGNSATATKLSSAKTISLTGDVTGSTSFDGSGNVSITATVADDSHNHTIANIDNLQSALDGKSATSHTHTADAIVSMANVLFGTNSAGGVEYSYGSGSGKNVLTEISNMAQGLHTAYAISGTTGNPKTNESFRYLIHKTSGTIGWILAWDAQGSLFTNYQSAAGTFKGWKCVYDANPSALWTGGYYMSSTDGNPQTVRPSKKLSECRNGWVLVWSDYDPNTSTKNNTDIHHDYVFKKNCADANWSGQCMLCDIPRYMGSNSQDVDTERRILKAIYIHDDRIEGSYQGSYDERNDVILRAVYEF